jgi:hypothetical protein
MYKLLIGCLLLGLSMMAQTMPVISLPFSTGNGNEADLAFSVTDPNGIANITEIRVLIKHEINAENACYLVHYPGTANVLLRNDTNADWGTPVNFGSAETATNSQCTIYGGPSAMTVTGDTYTLKLHLHFSGTFAGLRRIWGQTVDKTNPAATRWSLVGEWVVPEHPELPWRVDRIKVANAIPQAIEMSVTPAPGVAIRVFRNGLLQAAADDYSVTDRQIVFLTPIRIGDLFQVEYMPLCKPR